MAVVCVVTKDKPPAKRRRGRYPKEFHKDVAALVLDQKRAPDGLEVLEEVQDHRGVQIGGGQRARRLGVSDF